MSATESVEWEISVHRFTYEHHETEAQCKALEADLRARHPHLNRLDITDCLAPLPHRAMKVEHALRMRPTGLANAEGVAEAASLLFTTIERGRNA